MKPTQSSHKKAAVRETDVMLVSSDNIDPIAMVTCDVNDGNVRQI